jgi:hypothetical protein
MTETLKAISRVSLQQATLVWEPDEQGTVRMVTIEQGLEGDLNGSRIITVEEQLLRILTTG